MQEFNNLTTLSITATLKDFKIFINKAKTYGFIVKQYKTKGPEGEQNQLVIYTSKTNVKSTKILYKKETRGSYKGFMTSLVNIIDDEKLSNFINFLKKENFYMKYLGLDGGWLGFSYHLLFYRPNFYQSLEQISDNEKEVVPSLDYYQKKYGYNYSLEVKEESLQKHKLLVKELTLEAEKYGI